MAQWWTRAVALRDHIGGGSAGPHTVPCADAAGTVGTTLDLGLKVNPLLYCVFACAYQQIPAPPPRHTPRERAARSTSRRNRRDICRPKIAHHPVRRCRAACVVVHLRRARRRSVLRALRRSEIDDQDQVSGTPTFTNRRSVT